MSNRRPLRGRRVSPEPRQGGADTTRGGPSRNDGPAGLGWTEPPREMSACAEGRGLYPGGLWPSCNPGGRLILLDEGRGGGADYNSGLFHDMAKPSPVIVQAPPVPSYEDALTELERLVAAMEGGQMPLDKLLDAYRRGADLLGVCRSRLDAVEQQVKVLEDGQLKPWAA